MHTKKRTIFYLIDGARPDVMARLLDQGELPHLKRIIDEGTFREATTCFPSTTGPAYLPFLTGHFPGTMNIPGIRWFDKSEFKKSRINRYAMRSYCGPEAAWFNTDMPPGKKTLFELLEESYNVYNMITRGLADPYDLGKKGKSWLYTRAHFFKRHHPVDQQGHDRIMKLLQSGRDFDFLFAVFPSVDWDSHYYDIESERTMAAYKIADESIGQVREQMEKKGWWKKTLFILTSDHGLTPTHSHFDLADWLTAQKLKSLSYPVIWRTQPKSSVMISGNSFGSIHLLNHPDAHVLKCSQLNCYFGHERFQNLLGEKAVDFITYRADADGQYLVRSNQGTAIITVSNNQYRYDPVDADPLNLKEIKTNGHRAALESTFDSDYPDALTQIDQLFKSRRAGDIIVSARNGYDLRDFWEYPEHKGSHGSLGKEHMKVPLIYNQKGWTTHPVRTSDLFPTILQWMEKSVPKTEGDRLF